MSISLAQDADPIVLLADVLDSMYRYVERQKVRACVVLDEFQEIGRLPGSQTIEATFRSYLQDRRSISFFFVGSRRQALTEMFTRARPLYQTAYLTPLERVPREDFVPYITERFDRTGKKCSPETAGLIYDRVDGYPAYVQRLAAAAWGLSSLRCTKEKVQEAYAGMLAVAGVEFGSTWISLPLGQRTLLQALGRRIHDPADIRRLPAPALPCGQHRAAGHQATPRPRSRRTQPRHGTFLRRGPHVGRMGIPFAGNRTEITGIPCCSSMTHSALCIMRHRL